MKRRWVVGVVALCTMLACTSTRSRTARWVSAAPSPTATQAVYDGIVSVSPDSGTVQGAWSLHLARRPAADTMVLLLNAGVTVASLTGRDVVHVDTAREGDLLRLAVALAPRDGATDTELRLVYGGRLVFGEEGINRLSPEWVELGLDSFWFPVVADFLHEARGRVRLVLPSGYTVIASGEQQRHGDTVRVTNTRALPDFAFSASRTLRTIVQGRARTHDAGSAPALIDRVLTTAARCMDHLNARYGARDPLPAADVVVAPRRGPGYARQRYVVISAGVREEEGPAAYSAADSAALTGFLCHEFAHYWSTGANPSGPENWLNEAFAEYVAGRAVRVLHGEAAWERLLSSWRRGAAGQGAIWTPNSTARPNANVAYRKAPALLAELEARVGRARMDTVLQRFMTEPLRTTPAVLDMIEQTVGVAHGDWFRAEVGR